MSETSSPRWAFKFRAFSEYALPSLNDSKIWFSSQDELNDPFEYYVETQTLSNEEKLSTYINIMKHSLVGHNQIDIYSAEQEVLKSYMQNPQQFLEYIDKTVNERFLNLEDYKKTLSIFSFSYSQNDEDSSSPLGNMPMWAHYADSFRGFCIKYDFKKLYESLSKLNKSELGYAAVDYRQSPLVIKLSKDLVYDAVAYLKSIQVKHQQWESERECRIVSGTHGLHSYDPEVIHSVFIGGKVAPQKRLELINVITRVAPAAKMYDMRISLGQSKYALNKVPVE